MIGCCVLFFITSKCMLQSSCPFSLLCSVNTSVGCIHDWHSPVDEDNRQTMCTLCNLCCEHGSRCPHKGMPCQRLRQSGCGTKVTGCKDCGICKSCANELWVGVIMFKPFHDAYPPVEHSEVLFEIGLWNTGKSFMKLACGTQGSPFRDWLVEHREVLYEIGLWNIGKSFLRLAFETQGSPF